MISRIMNEDMQRVNRVTEASGQVRFEGIVVEGILGCLNRLVMPFGDTIAAERHRFHPIERAVFVNPNGVDTITSAIRPERIIVCATDCIRLMVEVHFISRTNGKLGIFGIGRVLYQVQVMDRVTIPSLCLIRCHVITSACVHISLPGK